MTEYICNCTRCKWDRENNNASQKAEMDAIASRLQEDALPPLRNPNGTATRADLVVVFDAVVKVLEAPGTIDSQRAELIRQLNGR